MILLGISDVDTILRMLSAKNSFEAIGEECEYSNTLFKQ